MAVGTDCMPNYRVCQGYINWSVGVYINSTFRGKVLCHCESLAENSGELLMAPITRIDLNVLFLADKALNRLHSQHNMDIGVVIRTPGSYHQ